MNAFLALWMNERRFACLKVEEEQRLQAASVEKDFWVCWTLRELFGLPDLGARMTFKGGTSLSKARGLIERFSADIDIVVAKEMFNFAGTEQEYSCWYASNYHRSIAEKIHLTIMATRPTASAPG